MPKAKIIAIAAHTSGLDAALGSLKNFSIFLADRMYGTPKRAWATIIYSLAAAALGMALDAQSHQLLLGCAQ